MTINEVAHKFIEAGLSILPCKADKSPAVPKWIGVKFTPPDFIDAEGIGIICGKVSGGLECWDFDNHFGDAKENLSKFLKVPEISQIYSKYKLAIQSTQSGGYHLLTKCDEFSGNKKIASKPVYDEARKKWKPDAIIETRGEGGYFCAFPTKGYKVIKNSLLTIDKITPEERKIFIEVAHTFNEWTQPDPNQYESENKPGDIYNQKPEAIDEMKSALLSEGWTEIGVNKWRRPGKDKGISATIGHGADNIFYVFTSNAYPFVEMKGYTPFQVMALLKHNGDFKKAAQEIADRYNLNDYVNTKEKYNKKPERKRRNEKELDEILSRAFIDPNIPVEKPPVIMEINHASKEYPDYHRLFTLGNISCFTGKGKSKKTFLTSIVLASLAVNGQVQRKFRSCLPESKGQILHFDTEQGEYDSYIVANRIHQIAGGYKEHLGTFNLREFDHFDRLDIIKHAIKLFRDNLGFVLIDGVADLVCDINDVTESNKVVTILMELSKKYNIHISTIIHQNKNDNFATGHLGSSLIKKSEAVISVEVNPIIRSFSTVSCDNIRGSLDFPDFQFFINENTLPEIDWENKYLTKSHV
jgi:hypothetical protein